MRARISNVNQALMWACCLSSLACATDPVTSTVWRPLTSDLVVTGHETSSAAALAEGYLGTKRARSRVECVLACNHHPDCFSAAFDPISGDCYLQPDRSDYQTQPVHLGQVWAKKDYTCQIDDAQGPISNGIVEWDDTLTSPRWTATCNEEFMKTTDDISVTCMAGGSWQRGVECVRHIWTNPPLSIFPLNIPFPVIDGWIMCVEGIPTSATRFSIDLEVATGIALHTDFRLNTNIMVTNNLLSGVWGSSIHTSLNLFPISVDMPFRIKWKATSSNTFEIYVDDILVLTRSQHTGMPASDVTMVYISWDVNVTHVDLWCHI